MSKPILIYCYDALCGWCYGFSPVFRQVSRELKNVLHCEVLSGGMILSESPVPIGAMARYIQTAYRSVEELTGTKFGEDYLWHIFNPEKSDWFLHSMKPAIAMSIFKEYHPELQVEFAADLQYSHHFEGRDLTDDEAYRHLFEKYDIVAEEFYLKLKSSEYEEKARYEFALVKQLKVTGFPTVLVQADETRFYVVSRGYSQYQTLMKNIQSVIQSIAN